MRLRPFFTFDSLFVRMLLIVLFGLLAAQLVSVWLQWGERANVVSEARGEHFIDRVAEVVRILEADDPVRRTATLVALQSDSVRLSLISDAAVAQYGVRRPLQIALVSRIGSAREMRGNGMSGPGMAAGMGRGMGYGAGNGAGRMGGIQGGRAMPLENGPRSLDVRLQDGQWVRFSLTEAKPPALSNALIVQLLATLVIAIVVIALAVRQATKPIARLAQAADSFGRDLDALPLPENGPGEMRRAAQAFNRMQERIKGLVNERSRALAAVSHDLRTPLTRLRLRAESVEDEALRDQIADDLDAMAAMLDSTLDYLRGLQESEPPCPIDINALLHTLIEDERVLGRTITLEGVASAPYVGRVSALRRAVQNLLDNAIKYAHDVHLRIEECPSALCLSVEDAGPGVAPSEIARLTEPYYRPDAARRPETGGSGLGLSIVQDIALLHGGELRLANRPEGGFSASLILPRSAA